METFCLINQQKKTISKVEITEIYLFIMQLLYLSESPELYLGGKCSQFDADNCNVSPARE